MHVPRGKVTIMLESDPPANLSFGAYGAPTPPKPNEFFCQGPTHVLALLDLAHMKSQVGATAWHAAAAKQQAAPRGPRGKADPTANAAGPPEITGGGYGLALSRLEINRCISLSTPAAISALCPHNPP